jgi:hypothetical protein
MADRPLGRGYDIRPTRGDPPARALQSGEMGQVVLKS